MFVTNFNIVSWKRGSKNQGTSQKVQINESGEISIEQTYNISGTLFTKRGRSNFYRKPLEFFLESSRSRKTLGSCVFDLAEVSTLENNSTLSKELNFRIKYQTEPLKLKFTIQSLPLDSTSLSIDTSASTSGEISSRQNSLISEDTYHDFRSDLDSDTEHLSPYHTEIQHTNSGFHHETNHSRTISKLNSVYNENRKLHDQIKTLHDEVNRLKHQTNSDSQNKKRTDVSNNAIQTSNIKSTQNYGIQVSDSNFTFQTQKHIAHFSQQTEEEKRFEQEKLEKLDSENDVLKQYIGKVETRIEEKDQYIRQIESSREKLKEKLDSQSQELNLQWQEDLKKYQKHIEKIEKQSKFKSEQLQEMRKILMEQQPSEEDYYKLRDQHEKTVVEYEDRIKEFRDTIENQKVHKKNAKEKINTLKSQLKHSEAEMKRFKDECQTEVSHMNHKLIQRDNDYKQASRTNSRLQKSIRNHEQLLTRVRRENEDLNAVIEQKKEELENVKKEKSNSDSKLEQLYQKLNETNSELDAIQKKYDEFKKENDDLKESDKTWRNESIRLKNEKEELETQIEKLEQSNQNLRSKATLDDNKINQVRAKAHKRSDSMKKQFEFRIDLLEKELQSQEERCERLEEQRLENLQEISRLEEVSETLERNNQDLNDQLERYNRKNNSRKTNMQNEEWNHQKINENSFSEFSEKDNITVKQMETLRNIICKLNYNLGNSSTQFSNIQKELVSYENFIEEFKENKSCQVSIVPRSDSCHHSFRSEGRSSEPSENKVREEMYRLSERLSHIESRVQQRLIRLYDKTSEIASKLNRFGENYCRLNKQVDNLTFENQQKQSHVLFLEQKLNELNSTWLQCIAFVAVIWLSLFLN
eukprot:gb/GECH01007927.1/.p1 GENE.gb/GECH01007927.1/~~gb/GECH01007927.1/.p1  ORF type:complete len:867 (+),score=239.62 gb/GECH01007927.1/:1-2601(+)